MRLQAHTTQRGLTLLEIAVVTAIIALLIAIAVPAVQLARENARRASCQHKLRQLGVALHSYLDTYGVFPPGRVYGAINGQSGVAVWNSHVMLLPYVEARALYNAINLNLPFQNFENSTITLMSPGHLLCPSDTKPMGDAWGVTSYKLCGGSGIYPSGLDSIIVPSLELEFDGFFTKLSGLKPSEVPDGMSNTAAMSEMVHGGQIADASTALVPSVGITYIFHVTSFTQREIVDRCENIRAGDFLVAQRSGAPWCSDLPYTHLFTPGKPSCWAGNAGNLVSPFTASSRHRGGVNVLLADGHVRWFLDSIDTGIWRAIGSRYGGDDTGF